MASVGNGDRQANSVARLDPEMKAAVDDWAKSLAKNICPECKQAIKDKYQAGRCVYARPCGHRLYQGSLKGQLQSNIKSVPRQNGAMKECGCDDAYTCIKHRD